MSSTTFPASNGKIAQPYSLLLTGSTTWTCPAGVTQVKATIASGGSTSGGPGGYLSTVVPVTPGTSYPIVVGAANGDTTAFTLKATRTGSATPDTGSAADLVQSGAVGMLTSYSLPSTTNIMYNYYVRDKGATYFNSKYFMINNGSSASAIHTSTDGVSWNNNAVTGGSAYMGIDSSATQIAYYSNGDNKIYYSTTGADGAWSSISTGVSANFFGYVNGYWIIGLSGSFKYSTDVTTAYASWSTATVSGGHNVMNVVYGNGKWIAVPDTSSSTNFGSIATSIGGTYSTMSVNQAYRDGYSLTFNGGRFLLANYQQNGYQGSFSYSTDGITWNGSSISDAGITGGSQIFTSKAGAGFLFCGYWNQNMYYWDGISNSSVNIGLRSNTVAIFGGLANTRSYTLQNGTSNTGIYFQMAAGNPRVIGNNSTPVTNAGVGGGPLIQKNTSGSTVGYTPGPGINGWCNGDVGLWGSPTRQGAVLLEWWA